MHGFRALTVLVAAALGGIPVAFAGAGKLVTSVTPMEPSFKVTYSEATRASYIGYTVSLSNVGGNTINNIYFDAATSVTDPAELVTFISAEGGSCEETNAARTAIRCTVGQLTAGSGTPVIRLLFNAPIKNSGGEGDAEGTDFVTLTGTTYYAETTGGTNSVPQNSIRVWSNTYAPDTAPYLVVPQMTLGTPVNTDVKTVILSTGGTIFTGANPNGYATTSDPWTTLVKIPPGETSVTTEVKEFDGLTNPLQCQLLSSDLDDCRVSDVNIPAVTLQSCNSADTCLVITLSRDASTIKKRAKIQNSVVYYQASATDPLVEIPLCSLYPGAPSRNVFAADNKPVLRCIKDRDAYKRGADPILVGDWVWVIWALENGRSQN